MWNWFWCKEWDRNSVWDFLKWSASSSNVFCQMPPPPPTLPTLEEPRGSMWSPEWSPRKCHVAFPQVRQRQTRRSRQQDPAEASVTRVEEQPGSRRWKGHRCCARHEGTMVSLSREISGTRIQCLPHEGERERETSGESVLTIERRNRGASVFLKTHLSTQSAHACHAHVCIHMHPQAHVRPDTFACTCAHPHTPDMPSVSDKGTQTSRTLSVTGTTRVVKSMFLK